MFNDWAIKGWSKALSTDFPLDRATFILCSIVPLSYIEMVGDENFVVVDLSEIRKHTNMGKAGCDFLVSEGLAKWLHNGKINDLKDYKQIAIGTSSDYVTADYYFQKTNRISTVVNTPVAGNKYILNGDEFLVTIERMDELFERYKVFCNKVNLKSQAEKVHTKIKTILKNIAANGNITPVELLGYLDCVNAMVYDWTDIPKTYSNIKMKNTAKQVIAKTTSDNIIKVVPYFVEYYPEIAKEGYEETNIYNLNFHFTSMMKKMQKNTNSKRTRKAGYEEDRL